MGCCPSKMSKEYTFKDMEAAAKKGKYLIVVDGLVLDVTKYVSKHPGGKVIMNAVASDGSNCFVRHHRPHGMSGKRAASLCVGRLAESEVPPPVRDPRGTLESVHKALGGQK
ncbi:hypothetical protein KIPB_008489 [Kipferlia bialata]|uniref:Cytochrome b5 heme-binding domain-containing protein n=1 Tax=Kipferlia bialata TaxID=797122 RepID=A0A9K3CYK9_9EUKA|nr:hypothetical protein KIPB_006418 [Kipferlia bialata]GIQ86606.1 hypothetical protein KIPB_008489 [Kipferlia bialata]|eukprot:g6418.t1